MSKRVMVDVLMVGGPYKGTIRRIEQGVVAIMLPEYGGRATNSGGALSVLHHFYRIEQDTKRAIYQVPEKSA